MKQLQVLEITPYFNSQPHEEADRDSAAQVSEAAHFNSQPHEEADGRKTEKNNIDSISTHSLTKRLTMLAEINIHFHKFQLTASRRG